ncbi:hypothetical protein ANCDUO_11429 [Ancylostoma duodenale]|uniref:Endonuclease/exonuclease/phosphatase domain-containing protein n=1 Tax=Ancylostoma duodenale TaxID=51022 RepID=A0A0C2GBL3_9BILA|nr:hypothetical protein ANCDUO_11429 [Ancylostoma duodenale]
MNNRFQKRPSRKWTWISPNMKARNAIDFVLSADPTIFFDVDIIGRFNFVSDHRLVMAKALLKKKGHFFRRPQQKTTLNKETFSLSLEQLAVSTELSSYKQLKKAMTLAASAASTKQTKEKHISEATRKLYEERHPLIVFENEASHSLVIPKEFHEDLNPFTQIRYSSDLKELR